MAPKDPTDMPALMRATLARLAARPGRPAPHLAPPRAPSLADEEELTRTLEGWERELRAARRTLAAPRPTDLAAVDEEETPEGLRRRVDEYRGRCEGFLKALALTMGHEAAARVEAEARRRVADEYE
jgi:hypothetical protein